MQTYTRTIPRDVYTRALNNNGYITEEDENQVFSVSERYGYGVYNPRVYEKEGKYYCSFELGDSCD